MNKQLLSRDELMHLLDYDSNTGVFRWRVDLGTRAKTGQIAGSIRRWSRDGKHAYYAIRIKRTPYANHRLAWLFVYGEYPECIEWVDGDSANNAISNLLNSTRLGVNNHKIKINSSNTSGHLNVFWDKDRGVWRVRLIRFKLSKTIGQYSDKQEAITKAEEARAMPFDKFKNL